MTITQITDGGVTLTVTVLPDGGLQVAAESATYPVHNAFVRIGSDGTNPTVTVQQGADSHVIVAPAGAGDFLYDSAA